MTRNARRIKRGLRTTIPRTSTKVKRRTRRGATRISPETKIVNVPIRIKTSIGKKKASMNTKAPRLAKSTRAAGTSF